MIAILDSHAHDHELEACERLQPEVVDLPRARAAVRELLLALGEDPDREGLRDTPSRVARMYREVLAGRQVDPALHLARTFDEAASGLVLLRDIRFSSLCEHHMLPFVGRAHVAYLPEGRVVGLSKLARTVETFARRLQVQERLTAQVADALVDNLGTRGVLVVVESEHFCMRVRGTNQPESTMVTMAARGLYETDDAARREVLSLLRAPGR
ncbi:MAG: GTP cyclohydrolase I FolE [Planctomycetota bacterium]|nr:GTP cyclohydrolase I FolE [Planctomycetota bacterium]